MLIKPLADFSFERAPLSDLSVKKSLDRSSSVQYSSPTSSSLARSLALCVDRPRVLILVSAAYSDFPLALFLPLPPFSLFDFSSFPPSFLTLGGEHTRACYMMAHFFYLRCRWQVRKYSTDPLICQLITRAGILGVRCGVNLLISSCTLPGLGG